VVLECGLGGRLDSTNIIASSILSVITGIALDHTTILGDTIEKIAGEKAGIIKQGVPCLWCGESEDAKTVIESCANKNGSPFYTVNHTEAQIKAMSFDGTCIKWRDLDDLKISLLGEYQVFNVENVLTAIEILNSQGLKITEDSIRRGLSSVIWHARFEVLSRNPLIIADGGHNPEGVTSAVRSVKTYFGEKRLNVITGVMADKNYEYIAEQIGSICSKAFCITPNNPRALNAEQYANLYRKNGVNAEAYESASQALFEAINDAKESKKAIICLGSLYMYCEICEALSTLKDH
jgi:dihydrofolate synthase/folylpolyglutamate synthase